MRVLPLENEDVNECWIADRDRFSYEALNSADAPDAADDQAGRRSGSDVDWNTALDYVADGLKRRSRPSTAPPSIGALGVAAQHGRGAAPAGQAGARPRQREHRPPHCATPTSATPAPAGHARWLGTLDRVAVARCSACWSIGSFLRKDHPLFAQRLRQAARKRRAGAQPARGARRLADAAGRRAITAAPSGWVARAGRASPRPSRAAKGVAAPVAGRCHRRRRARRSPRRCSSGERKAVLLGNAAAQHPQAGDAAGAGALDRRADRRERRLPRPKPPTPSARSWSARCRGDGGLNAGADAARSALKALPAARTSSRRSTPPTPAAARAALARRRAWSSR